MMRHLIFFLLAFMAGILINCHAALAGKIAPLEGPPDGFERLGAPQDVAVILYHGGDVLGTFQAQAAPGTLRFTSPAAITEKIPALKDEAKIAGVLARAMPTHAELACRRMPQEKCAALKPEVAGVVFDADLLSAELFINERYLAPAECNAARYLPLPERAFSSVFGWSGAVNGSGGAVPAFTLSGDSIHAYGEARLATRATLSDQGLRMDQAALQAERNGWAAMGGLFRNRAMRMIPDRDMAGFSFATSMQTRLDARKTEGNPILLFLARRAFVSIYRDGRLYDSQAYEAGNQYIDTSALPEGAYTITLKIEEADGGTREEKRFFARSSGLPPHDAPVYFVQGGIARKPANDDAVFPQLEALPILRAGTVRRLDDNLGVEAGIMTLGERAATEMGLFWIEDGMEMRATALAASTGEAGAQASFVYMRGASAIALEALKIWAGGDGAGEKLLTSVTQVTLRASTALRDDLTLGLRGSYAELDSAPYSLNYGPFAEWRIWQEGESDLAATADFARVSGSNEGTILLRFTRRLGSMGVSGSAGAGFGRGASGFNGNARVWHDRHGPDETLLVSAGISGEAASQALSADAEWRSHVGKVQGSAQQAWGRSGAGLSYGGNFTLNMAQLEDELHVGGSQSDASAIIVEAHGDTRALMRVFVNGVEKSRLAVGQTRTLYVPPFHSYRVRLVQEKEGLLDFDGAEWRATLYPGNVARMRWRVTSFQAVIGRVVGDDGAPLANALLQDGKGEATATDGQGYFQAELASPKNLVFTRSNLESCAVELPLLVKPVNGVLVYRDALMCRPIKGNAAR